MALSADDRQKVTNGIQRHWSQLFETISGCSSTDLAAAVLATDDWIDDNQAGYNAALPEATRNNLTSTQKTLLFCAVSLARVSTAFLRRVFGEVD